MFARVLFLADRLRLLISHFVQSGQHTRIIKDYNTFD
jgi:hypothetical protein